MPAPTVVAVARLEKTPTVLDPTITATLVAVAASIRIGPKRRAAGTTKTPPPMPRAPLKKPPAPPPSISCPVRCWFRVVDLGRSGRRASRATATAISANTNRSGSSGSRCAATPPSAEPMSAAGASVNSALRSISRRRAVGRSPAIAPTKTAARLNGVAVESATPVRRSAGTMMIPPPSPAIVP